MKKPRGIRNHNPGNLRWGDPWQGLVPVKQRTDKAFCQFVSAAYGIRALARTLITYQDKHGLHTVRQIISRWAPSSENDTQAYVQAVASQIGRSADDRLDMQSYRDIKAVTEAIIRHENGHGGQATPNTWYDIQTVDKGLALSGIEPPKKAAGPVPVTRETIGATATGGMGIAQIADVLPQVSDAISQANGHLTSGSAVRMGIGVTLVAIAIFIAWAQIRRHQAGTL
ncbi:membrane protein [Castellaniella defragrans]|nr:membrane protein [Castellaniella defragrans]